MKNLIIFLSLFSLSIPVRSQKINENRRPNIVFILADDHRYDAMGFTGAFPGLETPHLDFMAKNGIYIPNATVATALCSPSRASILSGQYPHRHRVVDNQAPLPANTRFFPAELQKAGYATAFIGKWHMGNADDAPQPGFNHWISFKGQGVYYNPTLNIDGKNVRYSDSSYTTDLLTDLSIDWIKKQPKNKPFFLYLSHKGVHAMFEPARRHKGRYKNLPFTPPPSMFITPGENELNRQWKPAADSAILKQGWKVNDNDIPGWVKNQRYSWHGVDFLYHGQLSFIDFYRQYLETLLAVDESVGKVLDYLKASGQMENTIVIYMGDNGFSFGEHGLIDKRHAYEESMRVPMLMYPPSLSKQPRMINEVIQNIDIAPTILNIAKLPKPASMQGNSFLPLIKGQKIAWKEKAFYEYYWEYDFPQTPTIFALRTDRYKYIYNHGVWDINELYDLKNDPYEMNNLIRSTEHKEIAHKMRDEIFDWLEATGGDQIPLRKIGTRRSDHKFSNTY
jgi:N-acetylglucosamine-6-sulfatase